MNVAHLTVSQVARNQKVLLRVFVTLILTGIIAFYFFRDVFLNANVLLNSGIIDRLLRTGISIEAISIGMIGAYSIFYYIQGKPFSKHLNYIIGGLFIFLLLDIYDNNYSIIKEDPPIFSQILLLLILIYFILTLAHKLYFMHSHYGSFYEMAMHRPELYKFDIIPKLGVLEKFVLDLGRQYRLPSLLISSICLIVISWILLYNFFPDEYTISGLLIVIFCLLVVLFNLYYIAKRKDTGKFRIAGRKSKGDKKKN